jgi:hypothetical protein
MVRLRSDETAGDISAAAESLDDELRAAKEVLRKLAHVLARQAAREDNALDQAREGTTLCASPSTPDLARTSKTSDP